MVSPIDIYSGALFLHKERNYFTSVKRQVTEAMSSHGYMRTLVARMRQTNIKPSEPSTTCFNIVKLCILPTQYLFECSMVITTNSINRLVFVEA
jgi:hypothetical protein